MIVRPASPPGETAQDGSGINPESSKSTPLPGPTPGCAIRRVEMAKNTAEKEDLKLQEVYNTAEQEWASRVINTLLVETQSGEMTITNGFTIRM